MTSPRVASLFPRGKWLDNLRFVAALKINHQEFASSFVLSSFVPFLHLPGGRGKCSHSLYSFLRPVKAPGESLRVQDSNYFVSPSPPAERVP